MVCLVFGFSFIRLFIMLVVLMYSMCCQVLLVNCDRWCVLFIYGFQIMVEVELLVLMWMWWFQFLLWMVRCGGRFRQMWLVLLLIISGCFCLCLVQFFSVLIQCWFLRLLIVMLWMLLIVKQLCSVCVRVMCCLLLLWVVSFRCRWLFSRIFRCSLMFGGRWCRVGDLVVGGMVRIRCMVLFLMVFFIKSQGMLCIRLCVGRWLLVCSVCICGGLCMRLLN